MKGTISVFNSNRTWFPLLKKLYSKLGFVVSNEKSSLKSADVVFWFYGSALWQLKLWKLWFLPRKKVFVFWIGSDVLNLTRPRGMMMKFYVLLNKLLLRVINYKHNVKHITNTDWLKNELKRVGVNAEVVWFSTISEDMIKPVKEWDEREFDFVSYIPLRSWFFYGGDKVVELARKFKNKKFLIVIPDFNRDFPELNNQELLKNLPGNISFSGRVSREEFMGFLNNSRVLLRLTKHDGLSDSVVEALFNGCKVIWSYTLPKLNGIYKVNVKSDNFDFWDKNFLEEPLSKEEVEENRKIILEQYGLNNFKKLIEKVV